MDNITLILVLAIGWTMGSPFFIDTKGTVNTILFKVYPLFVGLALCYVLIIHRGYLIQIPS